MKIITAIASTTHIDAHGERLSENALKSMQQQILNKYIPFNINHDTNKNIGVVLYGKVVPYDSGEYALMVVVGIPEDLNESGKYVPGKTNVDWHDYAAYLDHVNTLEDKYLAGNPRDQRKKTIADLLQIHLDSTKILANGEICKIKAFIASTGDLRIIVYSNDHNPPHFHVISKQRKINARFHLETLELISIKNGKIREKDIKKIQHFFTIHPQYLKKMKDEYDRSNTGKN